MAVQIVKNPPRPWGNVIAQSLGSTLSQLAEAKVNKMKTHEDVKLLTSLGIDPLHARFLNSLPVKQRSEAVGQYLNKLKQEQAQQQQQSQTESPLQQILQPAQQQMEQPQQQMQGLNSMFNQGTTGSGINPQFLESLRQSPAMQQQEMQAPEQQQLQQAQQNVQQQQPQVEQPQQVQPKPGKHDILADALSAGDVKHQEALQRIKNTKQSAIDRQNAPFNKGFTVAVKNAEHVINVASNMEQLLDTGKVASGTYGYAVPYVLQNSESQQFANNGDELAQMLAGQSGVAGAYKIKFNQNLKPKLADNEKTQRQRLQFLKKQAEIILKKAEIRDELIEANDGYQLPNMETLINKRYKELQKSGQSQDTFQAKPNPALYKGQTIINEETGEEEMSDGKQWVKV